MYRLSPDRERTPIRRRTLLMAGFAGAINCAVPPVAGAATAFVLPNAAANRRFSVRYKGIKIGSHTVSYSSATGETRVKTDINLEVKVAFLTAYAFTHRSEEAWRAGRLISLNSDTVIFIPDEYLARNVACETGKNIIFPSVNGHASISGNESGTQTDFQMVGWGGRCEVHEKFTVADIANVRKQFSDVVVLAHPECSPEVVAASDFSGG